MKPKLNYVSIFLGEYQSYSPPLKVMHIVGARPNFMKAYPLLREMSRYPQKFDQLLIHTGQHYDEEMSQIFFDDLSLTKADIYLGIGSGSHAEQTGKIMIEFERGCLQEKPDLVIVVGDVNSTIACAGEYVHHGLGSHVIDGQWHTFERNLLADLEEAKPGEEILEVNGFFIMGSGRVDDIKLNSR